MNKLKEIVIALLLNEYCFIQYNNKNIIMCLLHKKISNVNYECGCGNGRLISIMPLLKKSKLRTGGDYCRWLYIDNDELDGLRKYITHNT